MQARCRDGAQHARCRCPAQTAVLPQPPPSCLERPVHNALAAVLVLQAQHTTACALLTRPANPRAPCSHTADAGCTRPRQLGPTAACQPASCPRSHASQRNDPRSLPRRTCRRRRPPRAWLPACSTSLAAQRATHTHTTHTRQHAAIATAAPCLKPAASTARRPPHIWLKRSSFSRKPNALAPSDPLSGSGTGSATYRSWPGRHAERCAAACTGSDW